MLEQQFERITRPSLGGFGNSSRLQFLKHHLSPELRSASQISGSRIALKIVEIFQLKSPEHRGFEVLCRGCRLVAALHPGRWAEGHGVPRDDHFERCIFGRRDTGHPCRMDQRLDDVFAGIEQAIPRRAASAVAFIRERKPVAHQHEKRLLQFTGFVRGTSECRERKEENLRIGSAWG